MIAPTPLNTNQITALASLLDREVEIGPEGYKIHCKVSLVFEAIATACFAFFQNCTIRIKGSTASAIFNATRMGDKPELSKTASDRVDIDLLIDSPHYLLDYSPIAIQLIRSLIPSLPPELPSDTFTNLKLFADQTLYLASIGHIDISFLRAQRRTSLFVHNSLNVNIPILLIAGKPSIDFANVTLYAEFPSSLVEIDELFQKKMIVIPKPEEIIDQGFERVADALTQGWTTQESMALEQFAKYRFQTAGNMHFLIGRMRKKCKPPTFNLRMLLNAYEIALQFGVAPQFLLEVQAHVEEIESLTHIKDLNLEELRDCCIFAAHFFTSPDSSEEKEHLGRKVRVYGNDETGYVALPSLLHSQVMIIYDRTIKKSVPHIEGWIFTEFPQFENKNDQILLSYFVRFITDASVKEQSAHEEFQRLFPMIMNLFIQRPVAFLQFNIPAHLKAYLDRRDDFHFPPQLTQLLITCPHFFPLLSQGVWEGDPLIDVDPLYKAGRPILMAVLRELKEASCFPEQLRAHFIHLMLVENPDIDTSVSKFCLYCLKKPHILPIDHPLFKGIALVYQLFFDALSTITDDQFELLYSNLYDSQDVHTLQALITEYMSKSQSFKTLSLWIEMWLSRKGRFHPNPDFTLTLVAPIIERCGDSLKKQLFDYMLHLATSSHSQMHFIAAFRIWESIDEHGPSTIKIVNHFFDFPEAIKMKLFHTFTCLAQIDRQALQIFKGLLCANDWVFSAFPLFESEDDRHLSNYFIRCIAEESIQEGSTYEEFRRLFPSIMNLFIRQPTAFLQFNIPALLNAYLDERDDLNLKPPVKQLLTTAPHFFPLLSQGTWEGAPLTQLDPLYKNKRRELIPVLRELKGASLFPIHLRAHFIHLMLVDNPDIDKSVSKLCLYCITTPDVLPIDHPLFKGIAMVHKLFLEAIPAMADDQVEILYREFYHSQEQHTLDVLITEYMSKSRSFENLVLWITLWTCQKGRFCPNPDFALTLVAPVIQRGSDPVKTHLFDYMLHLAISLNSQPHRIAVFQIWESIGENQPLTTKIVAQFFHFPEEIKIKLFEKLTLLARVNIQELATINDILGKEKKPTYIPFLQSLAVFYLDPKYWTDPLIEAQLLRLISYALQPSLELLEPIVHNLEKFSPIITSIDALFIANRRALNPLIISFLHKRILMGNLTKSTKAELATLLESVDFTQDPHLFPCLLEIITQMKFMTFSAEKLRILQSHLFIALLQKNELQEVYRGFTFELHDSLEKALEILLKKVTTATQLHEQLSTYLALLANTPQEEEAFGFCHFLKKATTHFPKTPILTSYIIPRPLKKKIVKHLSKQREGSIRSILNNLHLSDLDYLFLQLVHPLKPKKCDLPLVLCIAEALIEKPHDVILAQTPVEIEGEAPSWDIAKQKFSYLLGTAARYLVASYPEGFDTQINPIFFHLLFKNLDLPPGLSPPFTSCVNPMAISSMFSILETLSPRQRTHLKNKIYLETGANIISRIHSYLSLCVKTVETYSLLLTQEDLPAETRHRLTEGKQTHTDEFLKVLRAIPTHFELLKAWIGFELECQAELNDMNILGLTDRLTGNLDERYYLRFLFAAHAVHDLYLASGFVTKKMVASIVHIVSVCEPKMIIFNPCATNDLGSEEANEAAAQAGVEAILKALRKLSVAPS